MVVGRRPLRKVRGVSFKSPVCQGTDNKERTMVFLYLVVV